MNKQLNLATDAVTLSTAARWLRVPSNWLRAEVEAGRLPGLVCGRTVLVHIPTVANMLAERAKTEGVHHEN